MSGNGGSRRCRCRCHAHLPIPDGGHSCQPTRRQPVAAHRVRARIGMPGRPVCPIHRCRRHTDTPTAAGLRCTRCAARRPTRWSVCPQRDQPQSHSGVSSLIVPVCTSSGSRPRARHRTRFPYWRGDRGFSLHCSAAPAAGLSLGPASDGTVSQRMVLSNEESSASRVPSEQDRSLEIHADSAIPGTREDLVIEIKPRGTK